jgi:D-serine deaminase-like pyridoxal phosphate-dependent protein
MSVARPGQVVVDAGHKAAAIDSGLPTVHGRPDMTYIGASDEHGQIAHGDGAGAGLGDRLMFVPGHCDPTVNLHDWFVGVRGGRVERVWPVAARGALF